MEHLLEIMKIVEGAANADAEKVVVFANQLAEKLAADGDARAATLIRKAIHGGKVRQLEAARLDSAKQMPVDRESRMTLADESHPQRQDVHLVLGKETWPVVDKFVECVKNHERLLASGVAIRPSLIAHGPPGCGKSELARHIAAELNLPLLTARMDALISSFLGSTAKNIRLLFDHSKGRPCVLFLDELDALAKLRDDRHELGELKRVVISLLQNIDGLDDHTVVVAATNHPHLLDPAVWRRFEYQVALDLPGPDERRQLLGHMLTGWADDDVVELLACAADRRSGAEIKQLADGAVRDAVLAGRPHIDASDVLRRILRIDVAARITPEKLAEVRALNPKVFNVRRLAQLFGVSTGTVSNGLRKVAEGA